ncbi:MAG: MATE family efflux transporter [Clostridiales bacterium]|nr:MATE family efflux transporter [Clostridiales bacterium]
MDHNRNKTEDTKKHHDMTEGGVGRTILVFLIPMLFTTALQQVYSIADTWIVGLGLGDDALGAVGNIGPLTFLIFGFSMGLTGGFAVIIGQKYGAGDIKALSRAVTSSVRLSIIIAFVITCLSLTFLRRLLILLSTPEEILDMSLRYGYVIFAGSFSSISYNLCSSVLRALGDSRTPFYSVVFSVIFNFVFDWVSIFLFHSGVEGPASVTVISQVIATAICIRKIKSINIIRPSRKDLGTWGNTDLLLLKNGIPMAIMNSITAVGCIIVQFFINGMGVAYTSAYSVCGKYLNFFMTPSSTAGLAISAFTSQNYGAGKADRIGKGIRMGICLAIATSALFGSLMFFFPSHLASFMLKGSTQISLAASFLKWCGTAIVIVNMLYIVRGGVQGMGKPLVPMLSGIAEMILRIGAMILLLQRIGFTAAAFAEIAAWVGAFGMNGTACLYSIRKLNGAGHSRTADLRKA